MVLHVSSFLGTPALALALLLAYVHQLAQPDADHRMTQKRDRFVDYHKGSPIA